MSKKMTKPERRVAARKIKQIQDYLTPQEAKQLRKARRRTPESTSRVGVKTWAAEQDLKRKAELVAAGLLTLPAVKKEAPAEEPAAEGDAPAEE